MLWICCVVSWQRKKVASTSSSNNDAIISQLKEEINHLKNELQYSNNEVEFLKFEVEKMEHQIDILTNSNKEMSVQLNDWRREVNKRLSRLEEQLNKPYTEEIIETHVNVINK